MYTTNDAGWIKTQKSNKCTLQSTSKMSVCIRYMLWVRIGNESEHKFFGTNSQGEMVYVHEFYFGVFLFIFVCVRMFCEEHYIIFFPICLRCSSTSFKPVNMKFAQWNIDFILIEWAKIVFLSPDNSRWLKIQ